MNSHSFLAFHELSEKLRFLWASPSVEDVLGYSAEEIVGKSPWDMVDDGDVPNSFDALKENVMNDLVVTQLINRFRHKDGHLVYNLIVFSTCYNMIVVCQSLISRPTSEGEYQKLRAHSTAMTRIVGDKSEVKPSSLQYLPPSSPPSSSPPSPPPTIHSLSAISEFARIKRHHEAFKSKSWNTQFLEPEPRVCLLLNRFTRNLAIIYASPACEAVLQVDSNDITGKPLLLFIRSDDLAPFVEQMESVKASSSIVNMRLWFQSPNSPTEVPCEAVVIGSTDAIMVIIRRYRPFVRKYFIENQEHYQTSNQSWVSSKSCSSSSPSYRSNSSSTRYRRKGDSENQSSKVTMSTLNRIRIHELGDKNDERIRPLACIPDNDPHLVRDSSVASLIPEFKAMVVQGFDDDEDDEVELDIDNGDNIIITDKHHRTN
ncbi:hypothetical protein BGZ49_001106 [Haplosporangium sp. Z 27]|nr:hypothetical protein BGZ49_001106 [Haplosporangium sp. Z 27]